ncbi:MAG: hypothetical protein ACXVA8_14155, partial [Bdellovibrionota bacterium]
MHPSLVAQIAVVGLILWLSLPGANPFSRDSWTLERVLLRMIGSAIYFLIAITAVTTNANDHMLFIAFTGAAGLFLAV